LHINPSGKFIIGGPQGDAGLTGRKCLWRQVAGGESYSAGGGRLPIQGIKTLQISRI